MPVMDEAFAKTFAHEWIESWNSHDVERVLSHYSDDFEMSSPFIAKHGNAATGTLKGKQAIRLYWTNSMKNYPELAFRLIDVLFSVDTVCIYFHSKLGLRAMEWLRFNSDGQVETASCSYNALPEDISGSLTGNIVNERFATSFAAEWEEAWNSHDLARVLSHYTEDFQMTSPFIARIASNASGTLTGKGNVGAYWSKALEKYSDLSFKVHDVLFCVNSICIYYDSILGLRAVEWLQFDQGGKVVEASGSYNRMP
jgi:ketosteroid isomerase-like protein